MRYLASTFSPSMLTPGADLTATVKEINLKQLKSEQCQCMSVSEKEVQQCFVKQHIGKAAGPDRITGKVIKQCSHQLAPIFTVLFNDSFK